MLWKQLQLQSSVCVCVNLLQACDVPHSQNEHNLQTVFVS